MNKKTRLFLMVGGGVLVAGIGTGAIATYLGLSAIALGGPDGPPELKYVPADARLVAFAEVGELMRSEFRRQLMQQQGAQTHRSDDLQAQTGINPETDIDSVVMFVAGATADPRERGLVLARGRFDAARIEHLVRERGGVVSDYKGKRVLQHAEQSGLETGLTFVEPDLLALGSLAGVRQAIDLAAGGASITTNDEVMGLVRSLETGNAWVVGHFDALTARAKLPAEVASRLPPIAWLAASGRVDGGVEGTVRAEARDETAASNLREVIQGFVALARLQPDGRSAMNAVVNSLQIGGQGKTVSVQFSIPATAVAALASALPHHRTVEPGKDPDSQPRTTP